MGLGCRVMTGEIGAGIMSIQGNKAVPLDRLSRVGSWKLRDAER